METPRHPHAGGTHVPRAGVGARITRNKVHHFLWNCTTCALQVRVLYKTPLRQTLLRPTCVRSLFKDSQIVQGSSCARGRCWTNGTKELGKLSLLCHKFSREMLSRGESIFFFTTLKPLWYEVWPNNGCRASSSILFLSVHLSTDTKSR